MRIGSGWQEGEVVERQAARRAYEDFLHRRQDPALLEQEADNEFSARVFPIEARARKEIIVSYSHELTRPGAAYRLPLVGLPAIESLEVRALVGKSLGQAVGSLGATSASWQVVEVRKSQWRPDADFEVRPTGPARDGLRHRNLAVVRVAPDLPVAPDEIGSLLVLVDASAISRARWPAWRPECFTIRTPPAARAYPYRLQAHYFSRGPMGYGMGTLAVIEHDGRGGLAFDERPYVVMADRAFVELGTVERASAIG